MSTSTSTTTVLIVLEIPVVFLLSDHECVLVRYEYEYRTGQSTYIESDFFQQTVLGCMSTTTIDQYSSGKLALSAFCRGIGRHTCDDVLVLELGDECCEVAVAVVLY